MIILLKRQSILWMQ